MKAISIIPKENTKKKKRKIKNKLFNGVADDDVQDDEKLNDEAIKIIQRIQDKLTGDDYDTNESLTIENQVARLVKDACKTYSKAARYTITNWKFEAAVHAHSSPSPRRTERVSE